MNNFTFKLLAEHKHTKARVTELSTPHGKFISPVFMPVGTYAGVNNMTPQELIDANIQIILGGNTYHMLNAPGLKIIESCGGMHKFMGWHKPMLTDSGGFQVFSLSNNECIVDENGASFRLSNSKDIIRMTPKISIETQKIIGADIIMAFDQCTKDKATYEEANQVLIRTHRWLDESIEAHQKNVNSYYGHKQALFGIIQGGTHKDLRIKSTEFVCSKDLDGIAIGGETIGFNMEETIKIVQLIHELLPTTKPRYTMGVGMSVQDIIDVVKEGIDMFDCVAPTRNARHGALYAGELIIKDNWLQFVSPYPNGRLQIKKALFADDLSPIMKDCNCYTCKNYSKAFLHNLFKEKAPVFTVLATIHNVQVLEDTCAKMRNLILINKK